MILKHMAGLYAMQDKVATAHATLSRAKSYLDTLGPTMTAAITQPAAFIAMLAGDPATAEIHLRLAYESLSLMGERDNLATNAALLARAIAAQGESRYDEASQLITISLEAGRTKTCPPRSSAKDCRLGSSPTMATTPKHRNSHTLRCSSPRRPTC